MLKRIVGLLSFVTVSGCMGGGTGFAFGAHSDSSVGPRGEVGGLTAQEVTVVSDGKGNGYSYGYGGYSQRAAGGVVQAGQPDKIFAAVSGVLETTDMGTVPTTGDASFDGTYEVVVVRGARQSANRSTWQETTEKGRMTVDVNFATGTLTGGSTDKRLKINAPASAGHGLRGTTGDVDGNVRYRGVLGWFSGQAGADGVTASFDGDGNSLFYAGGFLAD